MDEMIISNIEYMKMTCRQNRALFIGDAVSVYEIDNCQFNLISEHRITNAMAAEFIDYDRFVVKSTDGNYYLCDVNDGIVKKYMRMKGVNAYAQDVKFALSRDGEYLYDAVGISGGTSQQIIRLCLSTGEYAILPIAKLENLICDLYTDDCGSLYFRQLGGITSNSPKLYCKVYKYSGHGDTEELYDRDNGEHILKLLCGTQILYDDFSVVDIVTGQRTVAINPPKDLVSPKNRNEVLSVNDSQVLVSSFAGRNRSTDLFLYDINSGVFSKAEIHERITCADLLPKITVYSTPSGTYYTENNLFFHEYEDYKDNRPDDLYNLSFEDKCLKLSGDSCMSILPFEDRFACIGEKITFYKSESFQRISEFTDDRYIRRVQFIDSDNIIAKSANGTYSKINIYNGTQWRKEVASGMLKYCQDTAFTLDSTGHYAYDMMYGSKMKLPQFFLRLNLDTLRFEKLPNNELMGLVRDMSTDAGGNICFAQYFSSGDNTGNAFSICKYSEIYGIETVFTDTADNLLGIIDGTKIVYRDFSILDVADGKKISSHNTPDRLKNTSVNLCHTDGSNVLIVLAKSAESFSSYSELYIYEMNSGMFTKHFECENIWCACEVGDGLIFSNQHGVFYADRMSLDDVS